MSVERSETPSASYVLRRRYGTARYVITAVSWLTVFSLLFQPVAALAGTSAWPGGSGNWTGGSWSPMEPQITDDATFPATGGTITLSSGEAALSLGFSDSYTLILGDLTLGGTGSISVSPGKTVTIASTVGGSAGLTKSDSGVLVLDNTATYSGPTTVSAGTLKAAKRSLPSVTSASLRLRLESDLGVTTSGSNVTKWNDQSVNAFHATQGTANNQPLLVAGASANGLYPAIRFDGIKTANSDYLSRSGSQVQDPIGEGMTMFVVYKLDSAASGEVIPFGYGQESWGTPGTLRSMFISNGANPYVGFGGYSRDVVDKYQIAANTPRISTMTLNSARNSVQFWDRTTGDSASTDKGSSAPSGALVNPGTGYSVGTCSAVVGTYAFKGDMFAVLVYTGPLSDADRQKVDDYLYNKYFASNPYSGQALPSGTTLAVAGAATFDMNGSQQTVAALTDSGGSGGTVRNSNLSKASTLTLTGGAASFSGTIESGGANGLVNVVYSGTGPATFSGTIPSITVSTGVVNLNTTSFGTAQTVTTTFTTPGLQTFVPVSTGDAQFYIWGAGGGGFTSGSNYGGGGGYTAGTLAMTAGKTYQIMVGGGGAGVGGAVSPPAPPVGGGGQSGSAGGSGQGGGLSGIFETRYDWAHALTIAGGGGGAGYSAAAGAGGGANGVNGSGSNFGAGGTGTGPGANGYYTVGDTLLYTIRSDALQGGGSWQGGDDGGGGGGGGGYFGGGAGYNGDNPAGNSGGGGGSGYIGGPGVSGATTTAGSGTTPGNTSSPYYMVGTGVGAVYAGGSGQVTLVAPAISGAVVTLTGGAINFGDTGTGAAVAAADFSSPGTGVAKADYAQPLTIGSYLKLPGGATASISGAASFTANGSNLADNSVARTLTVSGGTLTLAPPPVQKFTTPGATSYTPAVAGNVIFHLWGGGGGGCYYDASTKHTGGGGGYTTGTLALTAGKTYQIMVGGGGLRMPNNTNSGPAVPGGGGLAGSLGYGGQGGGLSGIFDTTYAYANALAIAGGGGGGGCFSDAGAGGGTTGQNGAAGANSVYSTGGSQTTGGVLMGSNSGNVNFGTQLTGGSCGNPDGGGGGGGGGGYWGGGGGSNGANRGGGEDNGGGGGSGFIGGAGVSSASTTAGNYATPAGNTNPYYLSGRGVGGASANDLTTSYGGHGLVVLVFPTELPNTHIAATASSTLDLGAASVNHTLGNIAVTEGTSADTILTVNNLKSLTIGTLTIGIKGANYGQLNLGTGTALTLGNGGVTKLAVTSVLPTVQACCVAVAKDGSFSGLHGTDVTDNKGRKWSVEVRNDGTELWLIKSVAPGCVLLVR